MKGNEPTVKEAISTTIRKLEKLLQADLDEEIRGAKSYEVGMRIAVQFCANRLLKEKEYESRVKIARACESRGIKISHDEIGEYVQANATPEPEIVRCLHDMCEEKTKVFWKARQIRTPDIV